MEQNSLKQTFQDQKQIRALLDHDYEQMRPILRLNLESWLPANRSARILDFGCGYGTLLRLLKSEGYQNCVGFEPDQESARISAENAGVPVDFGLADSFLASGKKFDCILSMGVVNYFPREEVIQYFQGLKNCLNPGGVLILEVINSAPLTGGLEYIQDPFMKCQFTDVFLRDILEKTGWRVEEIRGIRLPKKGWKRAVYVLAQSLWHQIVKFVYILERGKIERNPSIFHHRIFCKAANSSD